MNKSNKSNQIKLFNVGFWGEGKTGVQEENGLILSITDHVIFSGELSFDQFENYSVRCTPPFQSKSSQDHHHMVWNVAINWPS